MEDGGTEAMPPVPVGDRCLLPASQMDRCPQPGHHNTHFAADECPLVFLMELAAY